MKAALAASPGVLVTIASDWLFEDVVRHAPGAAPETWRPVQFEVKELSASGWVNLPDHLYHAAADAAQSGISTARSDHAGSN
ncbi:hypothetical protein [Amycolatopsis sp. CB00013]|uniref:hypothetical protein n=1 Tax=Amycolatopsis sp. CB00013 TaxID=1703945 RepID=UPI001160FDD3|nr:hypothetical protein [Amycolatopsis sp. CB00013]